MKLPSGALTFYKYVYLLEPKFLPHKIIFSTLDKTSNSCYSEPCINFGNFLPS